jgi:hypothetical protein
VKPQERQISGFPGLDLRGRTVTFPWLKKKTMGNRSYVPQPASNQIVLLQVGQGKVSSFENDTPFNVFDGNPRCTSL